MAGGTVLTKCKLWIDKWDLSGSFNAVALRERAAILDQSTFGDLTRTRLGGVHQVVFAHEGLWAADGTDKIDDVLASKFSLADTIMSIGVEAGADGEVGYLFRGIAAEYTPLKGRYGEVLGLSVSGEGSDPDGLVRGTIMHNAARTASGNGTARQLGAVLATEKVFASLHVIAATGTSLDVKVQSDDGSGFGTPTDVLTFTQATGKTAEWKNAAGVINDDWWRVNYTIVGGSWTFIVLIGIK